MNNKRKAFLKANDLLSYKVTTLDKLIFRIFGQRIEAQDYEGDVGCHIIAYGYRGKILIFDVRYFDASTSPTT